jgi:hypothetical protein
MTRNAFLPLTLEQTVLTEPHSNSGQEDQFNDIFQFMPYWFHSHISYTIEIESGYTWYLDQPFRL